MLPDENAFYAALGAGDVEAMMQTRAAMVEDTPAAAEAPTGFSGVIYIEVEDVDTIIGKARGNATIVTEKPRRRTA